MTKLTPLIVALPFNEVPVEAFREGQPLPFLKIGEHRFADYGDVLIDSDKLDQVVRNFKNGVRRQDIAIINEEHIPATYDETGPVAGPGAVGWLKDLYRDGDTVWAVPDWNTAGERLMKEDRYRGTSPELMLNWTDPETLEQHGLTAVGLALTNRPRMKNLAVQGRPLDVTMAAAEGRIFAFAETADVHIDAPMDDFSVAYAYPDKKRLPLHSVEAVKGARARFMGIEAEPGERDQAWDRVKDAADQHGVNVPNDWRQLKAAEVARWLMADGDGDDGDDGDDDDALVSDGDEDTPLPGSSDDILDDIKGGAMPPCIHQSPWGHCPGYTRSGADNDGGSDVCAMASQGCNGYVSVTATGSDMSGLGGASLVKLQGGPPMGWSEGAVHMADGNGDGGGDGMVSCPACKGSGKLPGFGTCPTCKGAGKVTQAVFDKVKSGNFGKSSQMGEGGQQDFSTPGRALALRHLAAARKANVDRVARGEQPIVGGQRVPVSHPDYNGPTSKKEAQAIKDARPSSTKKKKSAFGQYTDAQLRQLAAKGQQGSPQSVAAAENQKESMQMPEEEQLAQSQVEGEQEQQLDGGTPEVEQEPQAEASPADFAELQVMYRAQEQRLQLAEANAKAAVDELNRMETARKLSEAQTRIDALVRSGRITPAVVEKLGPQLPKFAEDNTFLDVLEALPVNSAMNMSELGSASQRSDDVTDTQAHHEAAIALMKERGQSTDMRRKGFSEDYAQALRDRAHIGYSPR